MRVLLRLVLAFLALGLLSPSCQAQTGHPKKSDLVGETQALRTSINGPTELAYDKAGFLYIIESVHPRILRLNLQQASIKTVVQYGADEDFNPSAVAADQRGNVFIGDSNGRLRKLDTHSGAVTELVPKTTSSGSDLLDRPASMAVDAQGNVLIVEPHKLLRWQPQAGLETVAGTGRGEFSGEGASARAASLHFPSGVAVNKAGDIFIADFQNCRIRKIDNKTRIITTIAGTGVCGSAGDGAAAITAMVDYPSSLVVDKNGSLFFVEGATARVRRIDRLGVITTYAGTGEKGFSGDGKVATRAKLNNPSGLAVDESGNLYIADFVSNRIRRVDAQTHVITTVAGNGKPARADVML